MSTLPPPDPAEGNAASVAASEARDAAEQQLKSGALDLPGLFAAADAETGHHTIGHMHVKAALVALPHIGEVKAARILAELAIAGDEHIDVLGGKQRQALQAAVAAAV
jgi:S13-like protein